MRKLSEALPPLDSSSTKSICESGSKAPSQEQEATLKRAATAWAGLKQIYGTAFTTSYGQHPSRMWLRAIHQLTDEQVSRGLDRLAQDKREFPVNLPTFVDACKGQGPGPRYLGVPPEDPKLLKHDRRITAVGEESIAHARRVLGMPEGRGRPDEN